MPYSKLVRDKIPKIIKSQGINPNIHIADDVEFNNALLEKLREEAEEFIEKPSEEEIADILEVLYAIIKQNGWNIENIENLRIKKAKERGAFDKKIIYLIE